MLGAALAMAASTVLSCYACRHGDPAAVTGWHMALGSVPLLMAHAVSNVLIASSDLSPLPP